MVVAGVLGRVRCWYPVGGLPEYSSGPGQMHQEEAILEETARLESRLKAVRRKGNLAVEAQICNLLGKKYELLGNWHEALTFHHFDAEIGAAMDDYSGQFMALNNTALIYAR